MASPVRDESRSDPSGRDVRSPEARLAALLSDSPSRDLADWRWLWEGDRPFPVTSHRGILGRLLVAAKRLFRPFFRAPLSDLFERQRVFNLIVLERLQQLEDQRLGDRLTEFEDGLPDRLRQVLEHNDALFSRVDQKLDLYRRQASDLAETLGAALAVAETEEGQSGDRAAALVRARDEQGYLELERRFRGTEEEIAERLSIYLPRLEGRGAVLDLGCGRGEALKLLAARGIEARGLDSSAAMVERCRAAGLTAEEGDLFEALAALPPESLGGIVSFHVIEHLPATAVDRLVRLAWRALAPGGALILETPNPLSVVVAARNFWLDPTHLRPIHPESLELSYRLAGFEPVERLELRPFPAEARLPDLDLAALPEDQRPLAERVLRLRDQLDELIYGYQDYTVVGEKPAREAGG